MNTCETSGTQVPGTQSGPSGMGAQQRHGESTPEQVALSTEHMQLPTRQGTPRAPQARTELSATMHPCDSQRLWNSQGSFSCLPPFLFPGSISGQTLEVPNCNHTGARAWEGEQGWALSCPLGLPEGA